MNNQQYYKYRLERLVSNLSEMTEETLGNRLFVLSVIAGNNKTRKEGTVSVPVNTLVEWRGCLCNRDDYGGLEDAERNDGIIKELSDIIAKAKEK